MIPTRPQVAIDGMYTQAQAAKALEVDRHTIKKYTLNGMLKTRIRKFDMKEVIPGKQIIKLWESCMF